MGYVTVLLILLLRHLRGFGQDSYADGQGRGVRVECKGFLIRAALHGSAVIQGKVEA